MWISDTLSREYRNTTESSRHDTTEVPALEEINHAENLSIPPDKIKQLRRETTSDKTMQSIISAVKNGWPTSKRPYSNDLSPFYEKRSELIVDNGLVFARVRLVVPTSMRKEMLTQIHRTHIGIEGCLWRAREVLYWPLMNAEIKGLVLKRPTCQAHQPAQCREELKPYPIPFLPGETVSINLFKLRKQHFVLLWTTGADSLRSKNSRELLLIKSY